MEKEMIQNNLNYLLSKLEGLKAKGLISKYTHRKSEKFYIIEIFRMEDSNSITIKTNLKDAYWISFEDYYEEFTDYLLGKEGFNSHVDWFMPFVEEYLKHNYVETIYKDKFTGRPVWKELTFNAKELGRRQLAGYRTIGFIFNKIMGRYTKETR